MTAVRRDCIQHRTAGRFIYMELENASHLFFRARRDKKRPAGAFALSLEFRQVEMRACVFWQRLKRARRGLISIASFGKLRLGKYRIWGRERNISRRNGRARAGRGRLLRENEFKYCKQKRVCRKKNDAGINSARGAFVGRAANLSPLLCELFCMSNLFVFTHPRNAKQLFTVWE